MDDILFGQLKLQIVGKLFINVDKTFTCTVDRAFLLERKILKAIDEFLVEDAQMHQSGKK